MASLTKKQRAQLDNVLYHAKRAMKYIELPDIAIARKGGKATTSLHCVNGNGDVLYIVDKEMGSDICGLYDAVRSLELFLNPPAEETEF